MRLAIFLSLFLLACASTTRVAPEAIAPTPSQSQPVLITPLPQQHSSLEENELRDQISDWIYKNDQATYAQVAQFANKALRKWGYPFVLDAAAMLGKQQSTFLLKAGGKSFELKAGQELSPSPEPCGERFLRVHAKQVSENKALLVSGNKEYPFSLKSFRREKLLIWKGKQLLSTLHLPEPAEPMGLAMDGKSVFIKFPLDERVSASWWSRVARSFPDILSEDPYLVLRVERNRLSFDTEEKNLLPQEFEVNAGGSDTLRWRFRDQILELSSRCGGAHP
jgi:hypothetical protein